MGHLGILGIFINLVLATWSAVYVAQARKTSNERLLSPLLLYSVCFISLVFFFLVYLYLEINLSPAERPRVLMDIGLVAVSVSEILMVFAMLSIYENAREKRIPRPWRVAFWAGLALFALVYGLKFSLSPGRLKAALGAFYYAVYDNVIVLEVVLLVMLLVKSRKIADPSRARMARSFAVVYLSRYVLPLAVLLLAPLVSPLPKAFKLPAAMALFMYCSLLPILWIRFHFRPSSPTGDVRFDGPGWLEEVGARFGISQREREILALLLQGKSHRDIEEKLFISYHTVKNHVYNLYQKLGVRNRYQLFHLFHDAGRVGDPPGESEGNDC
jgi:DNA-binding CsgD family transcriptional regulator